MFSKGWGADETKAAFKRAGDLATRVELPAERFYALFGQAGWSLQRGEVRAARDIAERALREAEAKGRVAAFAAARQTLGLAFLFLGDLAKARSEFELALNSFNIESVSEASEKFLWDAGAECRACLAQASWYSGHLHRARQLIEEATGRELGPLPSTAYALASKIYIEGHRNDLESVVADAENLLKIGQQHGMDFYVAISRVYLSWARVGWAMREAGRTNSATRSTLMRPKAIGLEFHTGLSCGAGGRVAGTMWSALALIDEGLAMADEGGQHVWDAFLCISFDLTDGVAGPPMVMARLIARPRRPGGIFLLRAAEPSRKRLHRGLPPKHHFPDGGLASLNLAHPGDRGRPAGPID